MKKLSDYVKTKITSLGGNDDVLVLQDKWAEIVGEELAKYSMPLSMYAVRSNTLRLVICIINHAVVLEIYHLSQDIIKHAKNILDKHEYELEIKIKKMPK